MENTIKNKAFSSVVWKFLERFLAQGTSLIVSIIIARILNPDDYSVVSIVTIFFTFSNVLITSGLNTALIQKKDADSLDYSTVFWSSLIISMIVYGLLFITAPMIANAYSQGSLVSIMRVMGLVLPINAVKSVVCAFISSNLQFRKFFFATLGGTLISGIVGILMALNGFGAWSLVAQQMLNIIIDTLILVLITRVGIGLKFSINRFKLLFSYGWKILVSSFIGTAYSEITPLIIGLKYNKSDLSFYTKGRSFPSMISTVSTNTLSAVLFPVLSKYQDNKEKILEYTRRFIQLSSFIAFPLMLGLFAVAENFVNVVLTEKWSGAIIYIQLFAIACMFDMVHIGNCETIKAIGRSDVFLIVEVIKKALYALVLFIFIFFSNSPQMVAVSSVVCTIIALLVNCIPNKTLISYRLIDQIKDILPNLLNAIIMAIVVYFFGKININKVILLILQIIVGALIYFFLNLITRNKNFKYAINILNSFLTRRK